MSVTYSYGDGTALHFKDGYPAGFAGLKLRGGMVRCASGRFGHVIVQEIVDPLFTLRIQHIRWNAHVRLLYTHFTEGLHAQIVLDHSTEQVIKGAGHVALWRDEFTAMLTRQWTGFMESTGGKQLLIADFIWSPLFFTQSTEHLNIFDFDKVHQNIPTLLVEPFRPFTPHMHHLLQKMLNSGLPNNPTATNRLTLASQLLDAMLPEINKPILEFPGIRKTDIQLIRQIRDYLAVSSTEPTLKELATKFGTNRDKIKTLFPKIVGRPPWHYWQYRRCLEARDRLINSDAPLKAVHADAGYKSVSYFVAGFNLYLGCNPGELKRNKWKLDAVKPAKKLRW
jgi:AraC-like DNA-binding protein